MTGCCASSPLCPNCRADYFAKPATERALSQRFEHGSEDGSKAARHSGDPRASRAGWFRRDLGQFFGEVHLNDKPGFRVEQAGEPIIFRTSRTACDKMEPIMKTEIPNGATVQCIDAQTRFE